MAQQPSSPSSLLAVPQAEPRKRTLTCEIPGLDDISCMKCDEDCPVPRYLQCGHLFCMDCINDEVKHSLSPEILSCPMCRSITTMPVGGWEKLQQEAPSDDHDINMNNLALADDADDDDDDFAAQYNVDVDDDGDTGREYVDDDMMTYDLETVTNVNGNPGNEDGDLDKEVGGDRNDVIGKDDDEEETEGGDKEGEERKVEDDENGNVEEEETGGAPGDHTSTEQEPKQDDSKDVANSELKDTDLKEQMSPSVQGQLCPRHQEPLVKNRCKSCRTIESRVKKMDKIVGNKVQMCDSFFQDINQLQTAIHLSMDKVKGEIQERTRQLIAEIQKIEEQELSLLQQHREERIEKLRGCGQTLMEVAKGIRDELGVVQDKVEGTQDGEFNENMKELRKACQKKIPQPDQRLKLIAFVPGKEDRLSEVFGKIDEKPKD